MGWQVRRPAFRHKLELQADWQDAQVNSLAARMPHATTVMFMSHAVYGLGATVSPFVATAFVQRVTSRFYLYFTISLALALGTVVVLLLTFKGRSEDQIVGQRVNEGAEVDAPSIPVPDPGAMALGESEARANEEKPKDVTMVPTESGEVADLEVRGSSQKLKAILSTPRAYFLAIYIFLYVSGTPTSGEGRLTDQMGVEVTIGGWATTFLIEERGGNSSSGYVSSGFFGGLTVGRIVLIPVTNWLGHRKSVYI